MNEFLNKHSKKLIKNNKIDPKHFKLHNVKTGLRNENGTGVLVGLTQVSSVEGYNVVDGVKIPCEGNLFYRGYNIFDLVDGFQRDGRQGFEETIYLVLFGELPNKEELKDFRSLLGSYRDLPGHFVENMILKNPSKNVMNKLQRSILVLYSFDDDPENMDVTNILDESLKLISRFPTIVAYGYQAMRHYFDNESLVIHQPREDLTTAEYLLYLIRSDKQYTQKEVEVLDLCMLLHADHGANNSSFATHVVASSGTDTYSTIATAVGSLKGSKHGGANLYVKQMIDDIKENCNFSDKVELKKYLLDILDKKVGNKSGLIYGIGHAVYTLSDPRAEVLRKKAYELAKEKNQVHEYNLYYNVELLAKEIFYEKKNIGVCANVDLYSGFIYSMLNIPQELYTPIFAISRVAGWVAHRVEQLITDDKIIRPAYNFVLGKKEYKGITKR